MDLTPPKEIPTHCVRGHPAQWCTCRTFRPARNGTFTTFPMIRYPDVERPTPPTPEAP